MPKYTLITRSPVHVGSGLESSKHYGYVCFANQEKIALLEDEKLLKLFGENGEGIKQWIEILDSGEDLLEYLISAIKSDLQPEDIAQKVLELKGPPPGSDQYGPQAIREQIRSGGKVYIPGSSIKGAFRTHLLIHLLRQDQGNWLYGPDSRNSKDKKELRSYRWLNQKIFGKDANRDIFRVLQVGDVHFEHSICTLTEAMNLKGKTWSFKPRASQYIECIPPGEAASLQIKYHQDLVHRASQRRITEYQWRGGKEIPVKVSNFDEDKLREVRPSSLFKIINRNSQQALQKELNFWKSHASKPPEVELYLQSLNEWLVELQGLVQSNTDKKAIFRLGWGIGFNGITGGWQKGKFTKEAYTRLKVHVRRFHRTPPHLPLPKSRRMTWEGVPLGFVEIRENDSTEPQT